MLIRKQSATFHHKVRMLTNSKAFSVASYR